MSSPRDPRGLLITEEMYINMCTDIENEMGVLEGIEPIECLMRKDSKFTLCKAKYTKSEYKVFWAIGFDRETLKVQDVSVQW
ncbi:hypothetical protein SAMN05216175_107108 [Neptunomonas qingdaonensis]|uniref:Uncharacterized protein n=1 Tax=Neptunomonas qingdaonensis TaxID=1045558 RepID=A0A1I2S4B4_9GAMM|nr:hypothetical protein SAMN05216175_107108 [Neptunomonas qingdaonensis]